MTTRCPTQNHAVKISTKSNPISGEKTFYNTVAAKLGTVDHNNKYRNISETKAVEEDPTMRTVRFGVDHLEHFFEKEMGACEVNHNQLMTDTIRHFCAQLPEDEEDVPFYVVDLSHFARQYLRWNNYMSRIQPFYAVKSNPSEFIIRVLNKFGVGFDCASVDELDLVRKQCGDNFDCASRIIYAHPCKSVSHIRRFRNAGVQMTVVDNKDELRKLKSYWPEAKVLLRLRPNDAHSLNPLSAKFGASENECIDMLYLARELNVQLVGCTFHVGSRCYDAQIYAQSIQMARRIFYVANSDKFGFKFDVLDIGGGFMGHHLEEPAFSKVAAVINNVLNRLFPEEEGVRVISEPGRFFSSRGMTLVCRIIARRIAIQSVSDQKLASPSHLISQYSSHDPDEDIKNTQRSENEDADGVCDEQPLPVLMPLPASSWAEGTYMADSPVIRIRDSKNIYYINDGIYGTFNSIVFDQKNIVAHYLRMTPQMEHNQDYIIEKNEEHFKSIIFGPTCDSLDCIAHSIDLPLLNINDILWFPDVGSYTSSSASSFNGFKTKSTFSIGIDEA